MVTVSGKLAQFGSRLLVPVADALLAEFANNFRKAAAMMPGPASPSPTELAAGSVVDAAPQLADTATTVPGPAGTAADPGSAATPAARAPAAELNVLSLAWSVLRQWWRGLWGGQR